VSGGPRAQAEGQETAARAAGERAPFLGHRWHDLDLEARALAAWERARAAGPAARRRARERISALIDQDQAGMAAAVLYRVGAERMLVERESAIRRLLVHLALNRYAVWSGDQVRYFSKHAVEDFTEPVPADALALVVQAQLSGVRPDEVAIFRDETRPDPIVAIRVANAWFALFSWA